MKMDVKQTIAAAPPMAAKTSKKKGKLKKLIAFSEPQREWHLRATTEEAEQIKLAIVIN